MRVVAAAIVTMSALPALAYADPSGSSLEDLLGPREIALGEAMRAEATGAAAIGMNPSGLPLNHELVIDGSYGYRSDDQASLINASACDSTNAAPGCFFYSYAGAQPQSDLGSSMPAQRTAQIGGLALGYPLSPRLAVGSTIKYFHYDTTVPGESDASGFAYDAGATYHTGELNLGVAGYNLLGNSSPEMPRAVGGGVALKPVTILTLSFDMRWMLDHTNAMDMDIPETHGARYGGGAELFLGGGQTGFPVRIGALRDNGLGVTFLSGGLGFATTRMRFDVGGRYGLHDADGTMILASVSVLPAQ